VLATASQAATSISSQRPEPSTGVTEQPRESSAVPVEVRHVKLRGDEPIDGADSSTLVFDVYNKTGEKVTDVVVAVSFLDASVPPSSSPRVIVGPFEIQLKQVLLADYSVHYELRLRNLSAACGCVPKVEVLYARVLDPNLESSLQLKQIAD
jgi:hypothetical protein